MADFILADYDLDGALKSINLEKKCCPHCGSGHFVRHGRTSLGRQRYRCRECRRTFSETTGTTFMYSKKPFKTWVSYLFCIEGGLTLREISDVLEMNLSTAFFWRHKILSAVKANADNILTGTIEINEFRLKENFKGNRRIEPHFQDINMRCSLIMLSCTDSSGNIFFRPAARKSMYMLLKNEIDALLTPLIQGCTMLVSSRNIAYAAYAKQHRFKFCMPFSASYHREGFVMNNSVSLSKKFLKFLRRFRSVASKYMSHYSNMYRLMLKNNSSLAADLLKMLSCRERKLRVYEFRKVQYDGSLSK